MRLMITPNFPNPYDQRMVRSFARAFRQLGQEAYAPGAPLSELEIASVCDDLGIDVLIQVNRFRPEYNPLPASVRHVAWFQDVFPNTVKGMQARIRPADLVYSLGDPKVLGLETELPCFVGTLVTGVDEEDVAAATETNHEIDFSLCGFIPPPPDVARSVRADFAWWLEDVLERLPLIGPNVVFRLLRRRLFRRYRKDGRVPFALANAIQAIVEAEYEPLRGNLDIHNVTEAVQRVLATILPPERPGRTEVKKPSKGLLGALMGPYGATKLTHRGPLNGFVNYMVRDYPRLMDRVALLQEILAISTSVELYGPGWDKHPGFAEYHRGILHNVGELMTVFQRSRINLANNTHGLGLHSRTLECMAVGGFVFTHTSPNDTKPGGIMTSFEPGVHYGTYTPENVKEEALRWLRDESRRREAGQRAAEVIRSQHLWRHRAEQVLQDLNR